jgi:hypothetical protein
MSTEALSIPEFVKLCDGFCLASGRSRVWLSKRLFAKTSKIQALADRKVDVGVDRLAAAVEALVQLAAAADTPARAAPPDQIPAE